MTRRHRSLAHLYRASVCRMAAVALLTLPVVFTSMNATAQGTEEKPGVDVLIFTNGDQLTGTLVSQSDSTVVFHSDMTGDVNVDWKKVKSLHTGGKYAVIKSGEKLRVGKPAPQIPVGTLSASNDEVSVAGVGGEVKNVPTKDIAYVVKDDDFQKAIAHEPGFQHDWTGGITLGASLVESTQTSENFTGAVALVRTEPGADWLEPRNKTIFDATGTYGLTTQPFIPGVQSASSARTNILHGDIERDQYLTRRFYLLADASADHNIGSGLQVQQIYGGGAGYSIINEKTRTLDVKGDIHYQKQDFYPAADFPSGNTLNLIGATIGEMYMQQLPKGMVFNETGTILPAFNTPAGQPSALSAQIIAGLLFPVYKNFGFTINAQDNFVNNPPLGYKKNTFQFTAGVTYTLK
jgi:Protein of unknown function, DUF481